MPTETTQLGYWLGRVAIRDRYATCRLPYADGRPGKVTKGNSADPDVFRVFDHDAGPGVILVARPLRVVGRFTSQAFNPGPGHPALPHLLRYRGTAERRVQSGRNRRVEC